MADRVGQQFGNYHLVRFLGQNSFAEAYIGKDRYADRQVFIKILSLRLAQQDLQAFLTEARTIADLSHPNIVRLLQFGVEGSENVPFLVMDYAPQGSLRQRYPQGVSLPLNEVVSYIKQSAAALQYSHSKGVIHSDIKPENMLVGPKGEIQLSDFSIPVIERILRANGQNMGRSSAYTAPEQLQGWPQPASDQYALGAVVYELLSGTNPASFAGAGGFANASARPPLREKLQQLPEAVDMVVNTALAQDPQQRFGSIQVFSHALEQASLSADGPTQASKPMPASLLSDPYKSSVPPPPPSSMFNPNFAQTGEGRQTPPPPPMNQGNPQAYNLNAALPQPGMQAAAGQPASGFYPPINQQASGQQAALGLPPQPWQGPPQQSGIQPPLQGQPSGIQPPLRQSGQTPVVLPAATFEDETAIMQPPAQKIDQPSREVFPPAVQPPVLPVKAKKQRGNFGYIAIIVLLLLLLLGGGSAWAYTKFFSSPPVVSPSPTSQTRAAAPTALPTPTPDANATATAAALATPDTTTSTATTGTATSTVTASTATTGTPAAGSGTVADGLYTESITLTCGTGCNDPVHVTINTIQVDNANGRMIWDNTLSDITGSGNGYGINAYSLQTSTSLTKVDPVLSQGATYMSGNNNDVKATYAFVPSYKITYTLSVVVSWNGETITFNPIKITF